MYDFDFDYETNGIELSWRDTGGEISRQEVYLTVPAAFRWAVS